MGLDILFRETTDNFDWLNRFRRGDEAALEYVYRHTNRTLLFRGKYFIKDEFTIHTFIQEVLLKAWEFRERMESMSHIYRFLRMNLTWKCKGWYQSPANNFNRELIHTDNLEALAGLYYLPAEDIEMEAACFDEERLQLIENVIPYLSPVRKTMVTLYFKKGLSYKRIAHRFGTSNQAVNLEVRKGLDELKKIIHASKKVELPCVSRGCMPQMYHDIMDSEMWNIFKLRYEVKLGFKQIADKMNLSLPYIQQQYLEAHKRLRKLKEN